MSNIIHVLQLGNEDWSQKYQLPEYIDFYYTDTFEQEAKNQYDLVFIDREVSDKELLLLRKATKAHTLYVTEGLELNAGMQKYFACRKGKRIAKSGIQDFLLHEARNFYSYQYGEKFRLEHLSIAQGFAGSVRWNGNYSVALQGDYGESFHQIAFWRYNIPISKGQAIEMWLEYKKEPGVEIALSVSQIVSGSLSEVRQSWYFSEKELEHVVLLDNQMGDGLMFISLLAKGSGRLEIIALHDRHSRRGHGYFLPGGERYVASNREEVFCYFDPGDMKPPLNIYFSGYKRLQGFEGYYMMRGMGCPFLLIAEPRLEGGCFYMGSAEYERLIPDIIRKYMTELGFTREQVIMSGISMGTYGTLYYGCDILPHAMIMGKPLLSTGNVAANERLRRPGGFATSLDMLHYLSSDTDAAAVNRLNERFWNKFDAADWGKSKFIVSYMIEDDYDSDAYEMLISHLWTAGVQVYGKGIHGRHNDATSAIVGWFKSQYNKVLSEDFSRRIRNK